MKNKRHSAILKIIREAPVGTQQELLEELAGRGFRVTQATVSRDIKELRLVKVASSLGGYRYAAGGGPAGEELAKRARRAFKQYVMDVDWSGNLVVIKTSPGTANAVAAALDELRWPGVVGTLAGDDSILVVTREEDDPQRGNQSRPASVGKILSMIERFRS